jgi:hypothetical protein
MHIALHTFSQILHSLQELLSIRILKKAKREINPRIAPAGQSELQKMRPCLDDRYRIKIKNASGMIIAKTDIYRSGTSETE